MPFIAHMDPNAVPMTWGAFRKKFRAPAIALDGFVDSPPAFDPKGPYRNFDHHRGPPRDDMLCTAQQVLTAVRKGLVECFMPTGDEEVIVAMNDCDPDVCLSWYALEYNYVARQRVNPAIHRLYGHVHDMDVSSGLLDVPRDMPIVGQAAWVFDPYWQFRFSGAIDQKDARAHMSVLSDVSQRINEFVAGRGHSLRVSDEYDILAGGDGWIVVHEKGHHARIKMARRGVRAFVSVREKGDGRWIYTICRQSTYISWFPVPDICAFLNQDEESDCQFGGGDIVFGNARGRGSVRNPKAIAEAINTFLKDNHLSQP